VKCPPREPTVKRGLEKKKSKKNGEDAIKGSEGRTPPETSVLRTEALAVGRSGDRREPGLLFIGEEAERAKK